MTTPRMIPLPLDRISASFQATLSEIPDPGIGNANLVGTLAHHPELADASNPLALHLLFRGQLPPRDRELAILRTAALTRCDYEWGHHARLGRNAGLTAAEFDQIIHGPEHPAWSPLDSAILQATDELHRSHRINDATWRVLAGHYSERQLIELLFLIGHYHTLAYVINGVRLPLEPGHQGIPAPGTASTSER
ncbi:carboxymuconolactone decarboxylase family protein [Amycolatopsis sp. NPDC049868]|uniref:carboxymuconolactone decarboxylase family protein n=1 Tax=Amycolatopsis sp. NPDC049868 TaxID=3363934 RepID=UPI003791FD0E